MNENIAYEYVRVRMAQASRPLDTSLELARMIAQHGNPELWREIELMIETIKEMEND